MHFIDGKRFFIQSEHADDAIETQIENCLAQLNWSSKSEKIYKLNIFVDVATRDDYFVVRQTVNRHLPPGKNQELILAVIAQAPIHSKVLTEVFTFHPEKWKMQAIQQKNSTALLFQQEKTSFLLGVSQEDSPTECCEQAEQCFVQMEQAMELAGISVDNIIRQWNYIEGILQLDGSNQRYQAFNDVRSQHYGKLFEGKGYPAATGIGIRFGGVIVDWIAMQSSGQMVSFPIDNPVQQAAHRYSSEVLIGNTSNKTTPKFERARMLKSPEKQTFFISGTAAIRGEQTQWFGNAAAQTMLTVENIEELHSSTNSSSDNHFRIYIRNNVDFEKVVKICQEKYPGASLAFVQADICRDNLLVEIEGEINM